MLGFRTDMIRFPDERLTVIVLANRSDADAQKLTVAVADRFLLDDQPLDFDREDGLVAGFALSSERAASIRFRLVDR